MGHSLLDKSIKVCYNKDTTKGKEVIKMEEKRTKVVLRDYSYGRDDEVNLLLTDDQIRLLEYLCDEDYFDDVRYEILPQEKEWRKI